MPRLPREFDIKGNDLKQMSAAATRLLQIANQQWVPETDDEPLEEAEVRIEALRLIFIVKLCERVPGLSRSRKRKCALLEQPFPDLVACQLDTLQEHSNQQGDFESFCDKVKEDLHIAASRLMHAWPATRSAFRAARSPEERT